MTGTKIGAAKALETRIKKFGEDYQAKIGAAGGAKSKGRKLSAETKQKISESQKRRNRENH